MTRDRIEGALIGFGVGTVLMLLLLAPSLRRANEDYILLSEMYQRDVGDCIEFSAAVDSMLTDWGLLRPRNERTKP